MKVNNKLHFYTFGAVSLLLIIVTYFSFRFLYFSTLDSIAQEVFTESKREARTIGLLLEGQIDSGMDKEEIIKNLQASILNTDTQRNFVCMYNNEGIELCHPNPSLVGSKIDPNNSEFLSEEKIKSNFLNILKEGRKNSGIRTFPQSTARPSQIISVYPVKRSDWMVASHANMGALKEQILNLYYRFMTVFIVSVLGFIFVSFWAIYYIYKKYVRLTAEKIKQLNEDLIGASAINEQLKLMQEKSKESNSEQQNAKKRFVTFYKDELISVNIGDIAYFYLQEGATHLKTDKGKSYPVSLSLDDVYKSLDQDFFYRANRQVIINFNAIKNILLYGKNQLKLVLHPAMDDVLISKNKVADFKKWLEK